MRRPFYYNLEDIKKDTALGVEKDFGLDLALRDEMSEEASSGGGNEH